MKYITILINNLDNDLDFIEIKTQVNPINIVSYEKLIEFKNNINTNTNVKITK